MTGFLLDTNVLSEIVKPRPEPRVMAWIAVQPPNALHIAAQTLAELKRGACKALDAKRRAFLEQWIADIVARQFHDRILPFDHEAALIWGRLMGAADRAGRPAAAQDAQIGAVALRHSLVVVTRNARDFTGFGAPLLNPWTAA